MYRLLLVIIGLNSLLSVFAASATGLRAAALSLSIMILLIALASTRYRAKT